MASVLADLMWRGKCVCLKMPEDLRPLLSARLPYASLLPGVDRLQHHEVVASVGDTVTRALLSRGVEPLLLIYDCRERRSRVACPSVPPHYDLVEVVNPRSHICWQAVEAMRRALRSWKPTAVKVSGEEDLLLLPLIVLAPNGLVAVYGQPDEGVAVMPVHRASKRFAVKVLECFTAVEPQSGNPFRGKELSWRRDR